MTSDPATYARACELLLAAAELEGDERVAFLDRECGDDAGLRALVEALLVADARNVAGFDSEAGEVDEQDETAISGSVFRPRGVRSVSDPLISRAGFQPGQQIGDFMLSRLIGSGGMGQVWEAVQTGLRRRVALKLVRPELVDERSLELFDREARAGGRMVHPNLVTTHAYGIDGGIAWIAQELLEGACTLKDTLDELRKSDSVPRDYYAGSAELVAQVADGLQAAHDSGVVHRDIKPANILIDPDEKPRVTDFGLARVNDDSFVSHTGDFAGTYAYMSPEQVTAKRMGLDHRSDIFSLGVVLYELLALRRPFEGDTTHQIAQKIVTFDPPDPSRLRSQCPRELAVIAGKAMEKDPDRRYASMAEFAADLRRFLSNETIRARPPGPITRAVKWTRRNPAMTSASAVGTLALVVVSSLLALNVRTNRALVAANEDLLSLSAIQDLRELIEEAEDLWPPNAAKIAPMERWIDAAQELLEQRPAHEDKRRELRAAAGAEYRPQSNAWTFPPERGKERWWDALLTELLEIFDLFEIELLDPEANLPDFGWSVARRLEFARGLADDLAPDSDFSRKWATARAAVAETYSGLDLPPQEDLIPIGRDPHSGLYEFAHRGSGEIPRRDPRTDVLLATEDTAIVFVLLPGGRAQMGAQATDESSPHYDPEATDAEAPVHRVDLEPFFIAKHELNQGQWLRLAGFNPSYFDPSYEKLPIDFAHPLEQVTWEQCHRVLTQHFGLTLPTEAQWEYAARAGTETPWYFARDRADALGSMNVADWAFDRGFNHPDWFIDPIDDGHALHAPVGSFPPNAFGLHELHGNVWEWVRDNFAPYTTPVAGPDAERPGDEKYRVFRGGSYFYGAGLARSSYRYRYPPAFARHNLGVRAARQIQR